MGSCFYKKKKLFFSCVFLCDCTCRALVQRDGSRLAFSTHWASFNWWCSCNQLCETKIPFFTLNTYTRYWTFRHQKRNHPPPCHWWCWRWVSSSQVSSEEAGWRRAWHRTGIWRLPRSRSPRHSCPVDQTRILGGGHFLLPKHKLRLNRADACLWIVATFQHNSWNHSV